MPSRRDDETLEGDRIVYWYEQFQGKCSRCHGEDGDGGGDDYPDEPGIPKPANLTDKKFMDSKTDGELFYQLEMGGEDFSDMPDFGADSSQGWGEDRLWSMVAFIRLFTQSPEIIEKIKSEQ